MNYNIGDKVRVFRKSVGEPISLSYHYQHAKEMNQDYLYVSNYIGGFPEGGYYVLTSEKTLRGGDFFLEKDIELYTEHISPEEFYKNILIK